MTDNGPVVKHVGIGISGTLLSLGLSQWESIAAITAGFATALYMLIKAWQAIRKK